MGMLAAAEYMQLLVHATAQRAFGQHSLDGELDRALRMLLEQLTERNALQVADVAGVLVIKLVGELGARHPHGAGVDDDDMIAKILMGCIIGLVLALQTVGDLRSQAAQSFACGVDDVPVDTRFIRLGKYGIHGNTRLFRDYRLFWDMGKARKCTEPRVPLPAPLWQPPPSII